MPGITISYSSLNLCLQQTAWEETHFGKTLIENKKKKLTPEQAQAILLFQIEQRLRNHIALQVEHKFHGSYHNASHDIAQFIRNIV